MNRLERLGGLVGVARLPSQAAKATEAELVILCSQPTLSTTSTNRLRELVSLGPDWAYVLLASYRHSVLSLLAARLIQHAPDLVPEHISRQLAEVLESNRRKQSAYSQELARLHETLRDM